MGDQDVRELPGPLSKGHQLGAADHSALTVHVVGSSGVAEPEEA